MVHLVGTAALWTGVGAGVLFVLAYALTAPWWRSAEGRHLMCFTGALTLIIGWLAYRSIYTPRTLTGAEEWTRAAVYVVVALLLLWRLSLLWRRQICPGLRRRRARERTR